MRTKAILLIFAAMIWGAGFIATKWTLVDYGPYWSNGIRFIFASLIISPFLLYQFSFQKKLRFYWGPFLCSIFLFLSMQAQTIGLKYTSTAKSGFITALYAFFVPIILMFFGRKYSYKFWILLIVSLTGIALLCELSFDKFNKGDVWTLICAFLFAWHIIVTERITHDYNPIELNGLQCLFVALISLPVSFFTEGAPNLDPIFVNTNLLQASSLTGFIILGLFSSNIAFSIQAYAQKSIPSHIVGLIFLLESIFAAIFGYLFLNEKLSLMALIGCFLVISSIALVPKIGLLPKRADAD